MQVRARGPLLPAESLPETLLPHLMALPPPSQANRPPLAHTYLARAPVVLRHTALYGPQEIDERRQFLRDLESAGRLKLETVHTVRAEIQQRVTELQRVDQLLAACEQ